MCACTHTHTHTHTILSIPSYHDGEDVLRSGLVVQPVCGVDDPGAGIHPEQSHAGWVHTAIDGVAQTSTFVHVRRLNPHQLQVNGYVL